MVNTTSTNSGAAIDIVNATQAFRTNDGDLLVLDDVSISAAPGEFVALVGPSGSGKSTLLRLIAGLDNPLFGDVYVDGRKITAPDPQRALVFQDPTLLPWRTVRENVAIGPEARGVLSSSQDEIDDVLKVVGLSQFANSWPSQLSGGMAQRTALARAVVNNPSILLLDEPLGKLDALTRRVLQQELLSLWQQHRFTAILVTHDVNEALLLADRVVVFTPRPARIRSVINVELERPRDQSSSEFLHVRDEILALLDADLNQAPTKS